MGREIKKIKPKMLGRITQLCIKKTIVGNVQVT